LGGNLNGKNIKTKKAAGKAGTFGAENRENICKDDTSVKKRTLKKITLPFPIACS
jgi:hypothetical protein